MITEKCTFQGIPDCIRLSDQNIEIFATTAFGPRIIGAGFVGGQNFMKVFAGQIRDYRKDEWQSYGGHRFWVAPEVYPRTYVIDNQPVACDFLENGILLTPREDAGNGIQRQLKISLADGKVNVDHILKNTGRWSIEAAAWGITVMAPGGRTIIPQEPYAPGGTAPGCKLQPVRPVSLWSYTDMSDARLHWGRRFIEVEENGGSGKPLKIGVFTSGGAAAYQLNDEYFVKYFPAQNASCYPDFGCNCEVYTEKGMCEVESLSPLQRIEPEETVVHREEWCFYRKKPDFLA